VASDTTGNLASNGSAAGALVAVGVGVFTFGLLVILAHANGSVAALLNWYPPAGPLSGKTGAAIVVWLVAWVVLTRRWRQTNVDLGRAWRVTLALLVLGFLGTFPPVFELFG
jgi:hypothetical protein